MSLNFSGNSQGRFPWELCRDVTELLWKLTLRTRITLSNRASPLFNMKKKFGGGGGGGGDRQTMLRIFEAQNRIICRPIFTAVKLKNYI